jgi:hypothetical protein
VVPEKTQAHCGARAFEREEGGDVGRGVMEEEEVLAVVVVVEEEEEEMEDDALDDGAVHCGGRCESASDR